MTLYDMIDLVFSHNALVIIWEDFEWFSERVWEGMAHEIPEKYINREAMIIGVCGLDYEYSDYLNIRVEGVQNDELRED